MPRLTARSEPRTVPMVPGTTWTQRAMAACEREIKRWLDAEARTKASSKWRKGAA